MTGKSKCLCSTAVYNIFNDQVTADNNGFITLYNIFNNQGERGQNRWHLEIFTLALLNSRSVNCVVASLTGTLPEWSSIVKLLPNMSYKFIQWQGAFWVQKTLTCIIINFI